MSFAPADLDAAAASARLSLLLAALLAAGCAAAPARTTPARELPPPDVPEWSHEAVCVPSGAEVCFNARDDNCNASIDEGCGLTSGLLQFVVAWAEPSVDLDLEVTDPGGQLVELGRVGDSGLFKERDCPGRDGECQGLNLENVILQSNEPMLRGTYVVRVRLENLADVDDPVRVQLSARLGPKQFAVVFDLEDEKEERQFELTL